jgi:eukaryotic-like serine/threonine-protein kinase
VLSPSSTYKIVEKLGAGGMGEVYKAQDLRLQRTVAIKVMTRERRESPDDAARFLREARLASQISNPHIVTIHEINETDDQTFIVMEYVHGRRLREMIDERAITLESILDISDQICDGLEAAHAHGVIHRDIKPQNIIVTDQGLVKLLDFGLAKPFRQIGRDTAEQSLTEEGTVVGTLLYMSPEQLRGDVLDHRSDIFSFGVVLYEMLSGTLPFGGANALDIAASVLKDGPKPFGKLPPGTPVGLSEVIMRSLSKEPVDRYSSISELRAAIGGLAQALRDSTRSLAAPTRSLPAAQPRVGTDSRGHSEARSGGWRVPPTILVAPFESVSGEGEGSFIGVGLAYAITTDLAKVPGLSVLSKWAGAGRMTGGASTREVARELGATLLLEGEVMRAGGTLGIMARLTDAETGRVIWGEQYRGDSSDLFSIQDSVCDGVVAALKLNISADLRDSLSRPATVSIEAFDAYSGGRASLERRDSKEHIDVGIELFKQAAALDPEFALAHAGLCEAYWMKYEATGQNEWADAAIVSGDRALIVDSQQAQVRVSLGIVYHGTGKVERAIEELQKAIELQPLSDDAFKWLGRCYTRTGELDRAVASFKRGIEIRPGHWENYNLLGVCYYTFGRYRDAAEQFRRVITLQPDNYVGYDNLGGIYNLLGLYEDAVAMHGKAIEISPTQRSYSNLGTAYFYLGRYDDAIEAYRTAIDLNPRDDFDYWNLGDAYQRLGRIRDAEQQFEHASRLLEERLEVNPNDAEILARLALYQAKLRNRGKAVECIERAVELEPRNTTIMYRRAVVCALLGESREALKYLKEALSNGYSRSQARRDPDLEVLRELEEYQMLVELPKTSG